MTEKQTQQWMDLNAFVQEGYLQELNRLFLHPLGLALSVEVDEKTGDVSRIIGLWDCRDDPEGFRYSRIDVDSEEFQAKTRRFLVERLEAHRTRLQRLGYVVQPVPNTAENVRVNRQDRG